VSMEKQNFLHKEYIMDIAELPHYHHEDKDAMEFLQSKINNADAFRAVADIFKHLGDPTRLRIFWVLCHCEECVLNLAALLNMSSPAISHHLRPLKAGGLIVSRRNGKEVYYRAAATEETQLLHDMMEQAMKITCFK